MTAFAELDAHNPQKRDALHVKLLLHRWSGQPAARLAQCMASYEKGYREHKDVVDRPIATDWRLDRAPLKFESRNRADKANSGR
jgi:hypothetical protein